MEATTYKCPNCGNALVFDGSFGGMFCDACHSRFSIDEIRNPELHSNRQEYQNEPENDFGALTEETESIQDLRAYTCSDCGSRMIVPLTSASVQCPYCGNPSVLPGALEGEFKPDAIIPFSKTKEEAMNAFSELCKGKKLLPHVFASTDRIQKITGVYVPFWIYDSVAKGRIDYNANKKSSRRQGDYIVTTTKFYAVDRSAELSVGNLPVNSSSKINDTLMEAVEPFQINAAKAFNTAYLAGHQAERYDQMVEDCAKRAEERIRNSFLNYCDSSVASMGYTSYTRTGENISIKHDKARNFMMPVWILNTKFKDKTFTFAMNGQTGKMIGNLPVDMKLAVKHFLIRFIISGLGLFGLAFILYYMGVI